MKALTWISRERPLTVYGANADLIDWVLRSPLAHKALGVGPLFANPRRLCQELFSCLGEPALFDIDASVGFFERIWRLHPEFGPQPFWARLSTFQHQQYFYPGYRDHVSHQLKVFLLGLMIYDTCADVSGAIRTDIADIGPDSERIPPENTDALDNEFILRWLLAAAYHDTGYVLENLKGDPTVREHDAFSAVQADLNATLENAFAQAPWAASLEGLSDVITNLRTAHALRTSMSLQTHKQLGYYRDEDLLSRLNGLAPAIGLTLPSDSCAVSPFRRYYMLAHEIAVVGEDRPKFLDHGITSAAFLLMVWEAYLEQSEIVLNAETGGRATALVADLLNRDQSMQRYPTCRALLGRLRHIENTVVSAAGAIACHNVRADIWEGRESIYSLSPYELFPSREAFRIPLQDNAGTALAFLLRLADGLQDWGRPRFRVHREDDRNAYYDSDMSITPVDGKILVFYASDFGHTAENASRYNTARGELTACLDKGAVERALDFNAGLAGRDDSSFAFLGSGVFEPYDVSFHHDGLQVIAPVGPVPASDWTETDEAAIISKMAYATGCSPAEIEHFVSTCPNRAQHPERKCVVRWKSLHLLTEVLHVEAAADETACLSDRIGRILDFSARLSPGIRSQVESRVTIDEISLLKAEIDELVRVISTDTFKRPSWHLDHDSGAERLARFLKHRVKRTTSEPDALPFAKCVWNLHEKLTEIDVAHITERQIRELAPDLVALTSIGNWLIVHLKDVIRLRAATRPQVVKALQDSRYKNMQEALSQAVMTMPHLGKDDRLAVWPPRDRVHRLDPSKRGI